MKQQKAEEAADAKPDDQEEEEEEADQGRRGLLQGSWEVFEWPFEDHRGLLRGLEASRGALGRLSGLHWGAFV